MQCKVGVDFSAFGQQWGSIAQNNKLYHDLVKQTILVSGINSLLILIFSMASLIVRNTEHQMLTTNVPNTNCIYH